MSSSLKIAALLRLSEDRWRRRSTNDVCFLHEDQVQSLKEKKKHFLNYSPLCRVITSCSCGICQAEPLTLNAQFSLTDGSAATHDRGYAMDMDRGLLQFTPPVRRV